MCKLAKLREILIKKIRAYSESFPKYSGESKKGQEWCAEICYHARKYRVDTIAPEDVKFAIFGALEGKMRNRILAAEYLEGRFMNARTKGGAKEEFEHKKQGVDKDALEKTTTRNCSYIYMHMMKVRGTYKSLRGQH